MIDSWDQTNWYVVQSKPRQETLAAARVAKLDIEVFLPRIRQEQMVCGRMRFMTKALFPGYFFALLCPLLTYDAVRYAQGVVRVVGSPHFPLPLAPEIVASIRERIQPDGFIQLRRMQLKAGDKVTIEHGPLAGWMGRVEREWDDGRRVMILLQAVQQTRLLVEKRCLIRAEED